MKRVVSLCVFFMLLMLGVAAAENSNIVYWSGDWRYRYVTANTVEIAGYVGDATTITLPTQLSGMKVVRIGNWAFSKAAGVIKVIIPNGITEITEYAFEDSSVATIQIAPGHPTLEIVDGVVYHKIDKSLIYYPPHLPSAHYSIKDGTKRIRTNAFHVCPNLHTLGFPASLTMIDPAAVTWCENLTEIILPEGVEIVDVEGFAYNASLRSVTLPASVTDIGMFAFSGCSSDLVLFVEPGSPAERYAANAGIRYMSTSSDTGDQNATPAAPAMAEPEQPGSGENGLAGSTSIVLTFGSGSCHKQQYTDVERMFRELGIVNISLEPIDDLILGWLTKDGAVEDVLINGNATFDVGCTISVDSHVIIRYHTFPFDIVIPFDSAEYYADGTRYFYNLSWTVDSLVKHMRSLGFTNVAVEVRTHSDFHYDKIYRVTVDGEGHFDAGDVFKSNCPVVIYVSTPNTTLTVDNCIELRNLLTGVSRDYSAFAEKYDGQIIEFDGYISTSLTYNAGLDHVIDVTYGEPNANGNYPSMRIETEGLTIDNRYVRVGPAKMTRVHVVAEVDEYYTDYYKCLHLIAIVLVDQEEWDGGRMLTINTDPYPTN